jgi:hypothetical protein
LNTTLSAAIKARDEAAAEIDALQAKIIKLESALAQTSPAVDELAQLRAAAHTAALAWNGEGDLPTVDHKQEARLRDEVAAFEASKRSAQSAVASLVASRDAARRVHDAAAKRAELAAITQVLAEEGPKLDAAVRETAQAHVNAFEMRNTFRRFVLDVANRHGDRALNLAVEHSHVLFDQPTGVANMDGINSRLRDLLTSKEA